MGHKGWLGAALLAMVVAGGCAFTANPYAPFPQQPEALRGLSGARLTIDVTQKGRDSSPGACRGSGRIALPGGRSNAAFVQDALRAELELAGVRVGGAERRLSVELVAFGFNSMIVNVGAIAIAGRWMVEAKVVNDQGTISEVYVQHEFSVPLDPMNWPRACEAVAWELGPTMRKFVLEVFTTPAFVEAVRRP